MQQDRATRIVARWIFLGVAMLIIQVLLGGITRLTGSGLSITEWKPIMGAMPPMSEVEWQKAFSNYQKIAQYKLINQHFTLSNFKFIFFWEWFHRLWARLIGVVFLIPFIYFIIKKYFKDWMVVPLVILFVLGGLQGAIGWIMVKSGLNDNDVYVSHIRLAAHFMAAMVLICYALIFGLKLTIPAEQRIGNKTVKKWSIAVTALLSVQLVYGAFMAGLKAAPVAPTWPDINGSAFPSAAFSDGSFFRSIVHNAIAVHFIHRTLAYVIVIVVIAWWFNSKQSSTFSTFNKARNFTLLLVLLQVTLGILTVINGDNITTGKFGTFEWMAQLHQLVGMLLLLSLVSVIYLAGKSRKQAL